MTSSSNDLIRAAREALGQTEEEPAVQEVLYPEVATEPETEQATNQATQLTTVPYNSAEIVERDGQAMVSVYEAPVPPMNVSTFQKFGDLPAHLREGEGINLVEVKKLTLAVMVEALERASQAHENFPSPDAGFAVAALAEQMAKLTKDLEKSHDPQKILDDLMENALSKLTKEIVHDLLAEMKTLREETMSMVSVSKQEAFDQAFKTAVNRMGPAMKERLDTAVLRIARVLNVKEKPDARSGN